MEVTYWGTGGEGGQSGGLSENRHFFVLLRRERRWPLGQGGRGGEGPQKNKWHLRLAKQTDTQRCGIGVVAGPGGSKVGPMTTRSALRAPRGLGGRHVFLIEPRWSEESLILISGDRNPIFRGDSWESGSPRVSDDCLPVKLQTPRTRSVHPAQIHIDMRWTPPARCPDSFPSASHSWREDQRLCSHR